MQVICDYCGKTVTKDARDVRRYKHHFCNYKCYALYVKRNKWKYKRTVADTPLAKIKMWAEVREKRKMDDLYGMDKKVS